jgi:hypothetical protein
MSVLSYDDQEFYKNSVIPPPGDSLFLDNDKKLTRIAVDSGLRNKQLFPTPNQYDFELDDDINDCLSAKLLFIDIPMPMYMVNAYFNKLVIEVSGIQHTVTLANGDYTKTALATEIQNKLNAIISNNFTCSYVALTDNFSIRSKVSYKLVFVGVQNPLNQLLGFKEQDYTSVTDSSEATYTNLIQSEYRCNLEYNNYLVMYIDQFDLLKSSNTGRVLNKAFATIPKSYSNINLVDEFDIFKSFNPPIGRLSRLRIRFTDKFGNPYDFQGFDHRFELLFTSFKQRRKYANIFNKQTHHQQR